MKNNLKNEFDFSNLSVSKVPLYALLVITFVSLAISALGAFIDPTGPNYIAYALKNQNMIYCFSYNGIDHYITLAMGLIIGFYQFIFLQNKDYARAILIKGVKREKLFKEKVLLPIIALVTIVIIVKSIVLFENFRLSTPTIQIIPVFLANTLIVIVHAVIGFTVGVFATILSGTIVEALAGALGILVLPKAILKIADIVASRFLHGYASFYGTCDEIATFIDPTRQIWETTPTYDYVYSFAPPVPVNSIVHSLVWIAISLTLLFLLKRYFVKSYKYEKIGFINASKLLTTIICFSASVFIAYFTFSLLIDYSFDYYDLSNPFIESAISSWDSVATYNTSIPLIVFLILSLLLSVIVNLILTRKLKNFKYKLITPAIIVVVFLLTTIISVTGCFGYTNRMPDSEEIESVDVYTPYIMTPTEYEIIGANTYSDGILECKAPAITLTEQEDIELLQNLHLTVIENNEKETNDGLKIEYHLKDGTTIRRNYFYLSEKASNEVLKLWDTKEVKSNYELTLLNKGYDTSVSNQELNYYYSNYLEGTPDCYITSKDGARTALKNILSEEDFAELRKAIYKDIASMTSEQWFKPETSFGIISFNDDAYSDEIMNRKTFMFSGHQILIPVTSETKNTVEFLKKHNLFKYLENNETNYEAYLFDVNASEYWKSGYVSFGIAAMNEAELFNEVSDYFTESSFYNAAFIISKNAPLTHSTLFTSEYSIYVENYGEVFDTKDNPVKRNIDELVDSGYATKLSENTAKEYFEKSHFKYYSGTGGNLLLVYYPERGTSQTFIIP